MTKYLLPTIIVMIAVMLALMSIKQAAADHLMYPNSAAKRTLSVYVDPSAYGYDIGSRVDAWNWVSGSVSGQPVFAWWNGQGSPDVVITVSTGRTWVWKACGSCYSVVVLGTANTFQHNENWLLHELGHAIGFADHIQPGTNPEGYINPGGQNGYVGLMNYVYDENWFYQHDYEMMWRWWYA